MQIREAQQGDFSQVMALYRQLQPNDPILTDGRDRKVFLEILEARDLHLFVLVAGEQMRSTCYLNIIPNITRSTRPYGIIENVVTDVAFRGRGYGKALMKHAVEFAWSRRCYKVMLQTGSKRESTHAFYKSCGFSTDTRVGYIARPA